MLRILVAVLVVVLSGCASPPQKDRSAEEARHHEGKVIGGAGGALAGGAMAYSSAGLLCTLGGPLCAFVVVPAAILGGVLGVAAGSVVDVAREGTKDEAAAPPEGTSGPPDVAAQAAALPLPY